MTAFLFSSGVPRVGPAGLPRSAQGAAPGRSRAKRRRLDCGLIEAPCLDSIRRSPDFSDIDRRSKRRKQSRRFAGIGNIWSKEKLAAYEASHDLHWRGRLLGGRGSKSPWLHQPGEDQRGGNHQHKRGYPCIYQCTSGGWPYHSRRTL